MPLIDIGNAKHHRLDMASVKHCHGNDIGKSMMEHANANVKHCHGHDIGMSMMEHNKGNMTPSNRVGLSNFKLLCGLLSNFP
jgi:hypothetical protein